MITSLLHYHFFILSVLLVVGWYAPKVGDSYFRQIEIAGTRIARRKGLAVVMLVTFVIGIRLSVLPIMPIPKASIHDEFSYLLAGDTFAHGRLANPPHPMWIFFETFHVLSQPSYSSMYPPAQGGFLALGQLLGNPWFGVLLSAGLMSGAILWALQGWLPPGWALLGGIVAAARIGVVSDWMNSYWGGALAAMGGALVIGALPRIFREQRLRDALVLGLGTALLANSRPLEGLILCIPVMAALTMWLYSRRKTDLSSAIARVGVPLLLTSTCLLILVGYYNWRVTGKAFLMPEMLNARLYSGDALAPGTPGFRHMPRPVLVYPNPQFESFYNNLILQTASQRFLDSARTKVHRIWIFFLGTTLTLPLVLFPKLLRNEEIRFPMIQLCLGVLGALAIPVCWYFPHYFSPLTATLFILVAASMRHLRQWAPCGRQIGLYLTRLIVVLALLRPFVVVGYAIQHPTRDWRIDHAEISSRLQALAGKQLVLVSYRPDHTVEHEWVYNAADIDGAKIVWARVIPGRDLSPLLAYFKGRQVWILDADAHPASLQPYSDSELKRMAEAGARNSHLAETKP